MRLLRGRVLIVGVLLALSISACELNVDDNDTTHPTAIVITSTPTAPSADGEHTATQSAPSNPTATTDLGATATSADASPTSAVTDATATAQPTRESDSAVRAEVEAIEADVVNLRGLELLQDLDEQIIDREELARRVERIIDEEYSPEEARDDATTYWLLRLIPDRDIDLYQLQIDLLSEQIAGYYDPETKELVVVTDDGTLNVIDMVTMAHEIVHALQDQHFDLIAIDDYAIDADHDAAITALIEGDASLGMTDYMLNDLDPLELIDLLGDSLDGADSPVLDNAPRYISEGLLFSYDAGQTFATALSNDGGYAAIDAAFADPPASTEQILHPEKYTAANRDDPMVVDNPDVSSDLGSDWQLLRGDVLGEWDLQIMLEDNGVSSSDAARAAAGWGGSWFDIYTSDTDSLALLTTRWDSNQEATEFADALMDSFDRDASIGGIWSEADRYFSVLASGDTVVLISGTDEDAVVRVQSVIDQTV